MYGLAGDCKLCAFAIGKFTGTLKEQVNQIRSLTAADVDIAADLIWAYDSNPIARKGYSQAVIIPPGYIFTMVCTHFVAIKQSFGSAKLDVVKSALTALFESWPQLKAGTYEAFWQFLDAPLQVAD